MAREPGSTVHVNGVPPIPEGYHTVTPFVIAIENVSPEEEGKRWGQKEYGDAMQYVQSAQFFPPEN
jgi:hypothetical protein